MNEPNHVPAHSRPNPPMYPGGMLIDEEEEREVLETLRARRLFRYYGPQPGPSKAEQLEELFARQAGARYALGLTSGTAALVCALHAIGVGPGDEVIVPAYTWIASASAVAAVGAVPILAEVDDSLTLDPADVERKISSYTRAILPVHMRGTPCQMDELLALARRRNLRVVEDCAQADGASYRDRRLGSLGDAGCFSFQFNKILTSGEGGMLIAQDEQIWKRAVMFHDVVGGLRCHVPPDEILWGINFRMPELLAAVMLVQMRRLEGLLEAMRARKRILSEGLAGLLAAKGLSLQRIPDPAGEAAVALILFAPDAPAAARLAAGLRRENVEAGVIYQPERSDYHIFAHWSPILNQQTWSEQGGPWRWAPRELHYSPAECPRSLDLLGRAVHLDVNPLYTNQDIEEILEGFNRAIQDL